MFPLKYRPYRTWGLGIGILIMAWTSGLSAQWKIMPIGDSITDGVGGSNNGFRSYLYSKLQGVDFTMVGPNGTAPYKGHFTRGAKIEEFYIGGYGTGTRDIAPSMTEYQPDIILIHLGTNNMNNDDPSPYSENTGISMQPTSSGKLAQLLAYASQWANGTRGDFLKRIIVCKIIPRLTNGSLDPKIAEFNAEIDRMFFENAPGIVVSKTTLMDMNSTVLISDLADGTHPLDAGYAKMATEFNRVIRGVIAGDKYPPAANTWLGANAISGNTAELKWQSVGDDGLNGQANLYEMRYATFELTPNNFSQGILASLPRPQPSGNIELASVSGLVPGISYFFGIRTYDEMNNRGPIAFGPSVDMADTTSTEYCDEFTDPLAANWNLHPAYKIDVTRGELVNSSTIREWHYLAAYKAARYANTVRGVRAAMQWSELADSDGMNASGIAMMLNGPSYQSSGYLVRVRNRVIYLNEINIGSVGNSNIDSRAFPTSVADPKPRDILEVRYNPSATLGHAFNVYLNNNFLGSVTDVSRRQGNASQLYSGIVLYGGLNNAIDNFCLEVPPLAPDSMYIAAGDNKHGTVTQRLAEPLAVRVIDANNVPVSDIQVQFSVISGQATLSTDSLDVNFNGNIWIEAESGDLQPPYVPGNSTNASGNEYIYVPSIPGNNSTGLATYQIYIPKAGVYRLHLRGYGPDGNQNSCFYAFGTDTVQVNYTNLKTWEWIPGSKTVSLAKGFVRFTIKNRESGLQLDKILLTSNSGYLPTGVGLKTQRFSNITDASGSAYTFISFDNTAGQVMVKASAPAVPHNSELVFRLYADALTPLALQYASETILTGTAGQPLEKEFAVLLKDKFNNFCVGVPVEFRVAEGDGHFAQQSSIRISSNSEGIASARFTLGYSSAANRIEAALPEVPDLEPLSFQAFAGEGIPVSISAISGSGQVDTVQQTLKYPLVVQVLDEKSQPVLSYPVTFKIVRNNGILNNSSRVVTDSTDLEGRASVTWTLGDTAGINKNAVRIDAPLTGAPLHFTATALPEKPSVITIVSGDNQTGYAGEELPAPLVVKISDRLGNGREGQKVTFSVVAGSGTFSESATADILTDSLGQASTPFRASARTGLHQIMAAPDPQLGMNAKIFAGIMINPPRPTTITALSGVGQEGIILTNLAKPFRVKVTNPFGDAVPNVTIRFKAIAGGGTFNGRDSVETISSPSGEAEALLTLGTLAGVDRQRIHVTAPNFTIAPLEFTATALPGAAESLEPASDVAFSDQAEAAVPITIMVKDAYGNPKSGHQVLFTISQGNGTFSVGGRTLSATTNGGGQATVSYKMGTSSAVENIIVVTSVRTGSSIQLTGSPVLFRARVVAGAPQQLAQITPATGAGAKINSTLPQPFTIELRDVHGNPCVQSKIITFKVISGEGKFGDEGELERLTDASGRAYALLRVGKTAGVNNNTVRVTVNGHPEILPVDFTASTFPGDPDQLVHEGTSAWSGRVQANYTAYAVVKDIMGNLIEGQPVLFKVTRGGGLVRSASTSSARDTMTILTNNVGVAAAFWTVGSKPDTNQLEALAAYQKSPLRGSPLRFTAYAAAEEPASMLRVSDEKDTSVVHQPLAAPIRVRVVDRLENPVPSHPVLFTVQFPKIASQQGKLFTTTLADTAVSKTITTDANGYAAVHFFLSPLIGLNHISAEAKFNQNHLVKSPMNFYIEGMPSPAKTLVLLSNAHPSGMAGSTLTVRVRTDNGEGKPVGGHPVQFKVTDNYSAIGSPGTKWITLNTAVENGEAAATWFLGGKVGTQVASLEISAGGLLNSPLQVKADVLPGTPFAALCSLTAKDSVTADNLSTSRLTVTLKDSFDNQVPGKEVLFTSLDQGLTFEQPSQLTNPLGQTIGAVRSNRAGAKTVIAKLRDSGAEIASTKVTFLAGSARQMVAYSKSDFTVNAGTLAKDSLAVLVTDAMQNPVANTPVTFIISSGSGYLLESRLSNYTTATNSLGIASAHLVAGTKPGESAVVQATSNQAQLANVKVNFIISVVNAAPALVQKFSGDAQTKRSGSELDLPLQVRVLDSKNDPVANVAVRFTVHDSGAAINSLNPVLTDYLGLASARYKLGYRAGEPPQIIIANVAGSTLSTSFIAYAVGWEAKKLQLASGNNQEGVAGKLSPEPMKVRVVDDFDNGVANVLVQFRLADNFGGSQFIVDSMRTDLNGLAGLHPLLPIQVGEYLFIATAPQLEAQFQTVAFYCTVGPAAAYRLDKYAHDYQSMTAGRELNYPVIVLVTDQYGNRVPGETIQFTAMAGSGQPVIPAVVSDENGLAACRWILDSQPKKNILHAFGKLGLRNSPIEFTALGVLNQYPRFVDLPERSLRIEYNKEFSMLVKAEDGDGDALHYSLRLTPPVAKAEFDSTGSRKFTWKPTVRQKGEYRINLRVEDSRGGFAVDSILVSVVGDSTPVFTSLFPANRSLSLDRAATQLFTCAAIDYDNDPITFSWYVDGMLRATGPRFEMQGSQYSRDSHRVWVIASDGVKSVKSEEWEIIVVSVELSAFSASAEPYKGVMVSWHTTRESDNLGFDLLRASSERGAYTRITSSLIPSREDGLYTFLDSSAVAGSRYFYLLEDLSRGGSRTQHGPVEVMLQLPDSYALEQNFPNPFNPSTAIRFQLPKADKVQLVVFNTLGQQVRSLMNGRMEAGYYSVNWDGRGDQGERLSSGVYYYRLVTPHYQQIKKMALVK